MSEDEKKMCENEEKMCENEQKMFENEQKMCHFISTKIEIIRSMKRSHRYIFSESC